MKTTLDNFLAMTSHEDHYEINTISTIPDDAIITIFAHLAHPDLCRLCLVSKHFQQLASSDILWQNIADSILFSQALAAKSTDISYKDFCKEYLSVTPLAFTGTSIPSLKLQPRNADFIQRVKNMQLPDYQLLSPTQTAELIQKEDTRKFISAIAADTHTEYLIIHHAAQQQIGDLKLDFLNCTDYVVSLSSDREMMINNKLTTVIFTPDSCQVLIVKALQMVYFFNSDIGNDTILKPYCLENNLKHDDLTKFPFNFNIPPISKTERQFPLNGDV